MHHACSPTKSEQKEGNHELQAAKAIVLKDRQSTLSHDCIAPDTGMT